MLSTGRRSQFEIGVFLWFEGTTNHANLTNGDPHVRYFASCFPAFLITKRDTSVRKQIVRSRRKPFCWLPHPQRVFRGHTRWTVLRKEDSRKGAETQRKRNFG